LPLFFKFYNSLVLTFLFRCHTQNAVCVCSDRLGAEVKTASAVDFGALLRHSPTNQT